MKRFFLFLSAALLLLSAGCSAPKTSTKVQYKESRSKYDVVNDLEGVTLELLSVTPERVTFAFRNNSAHTVNAYGGYAVEKLVDGTWKAFTFAPSNQEPPVTSCYFEVFPGGRSDEAHHEQEVSFAYYYSNESGQLAAGTYRIIKPVFLNGNNKQWYYLAAEFTIS